MKNRIRNVVNFLAFNLLFFALYLNFIHKENGGGSASGTSTAAYHGTVLVQQADVVLQEKASIELGKK